MVACVQASLQTLQRAGGVVATRRKSLLLTGYLEALLRERGLTARPGVAEPPAKRTKAANGAEGPRLLQQITPADEARTAD